MIFTPAYQSIIERRLFSEIKHLVEPAKRRFDPALAGAGRLFRPLHVLFVLEGYSEVASQLIIEGEGTYIFKFYEEIES